MTLKSSSWGGSDFFSLPRLRPLRPRHPGGGKPCQANPQEAEQSGLAKCPDQSRNLPCPPWDESGPTKLWEISSASGWHAASNSVLARATSPASAAWASRIKTSACSRAFRKAASRCSKFGAGPPHAGGRPLAGPLERPLHIRASSPPPPLLVPSSRQCPYR